MNFNNISWRRLKNESWVTMLFLGAQIIIFILMTLTGLSKGYGLSGTYSGEILHQFGAIMIRDIVIYREYWRFLTPIFVHIGWAHLLFNSFFLYFAGKDLEEVMGHGRFFFFYLLCGIGGNIFSFALTSPGTNSISAGASTALFGMFGGFIALGRIFPYNPKIQYMARNMLTLAVLNILLNLFSPGIDMLGHIGGLLSGLLLGFAFSAPNLKGNRYDFVEDNVHRRIVCGLGYVIGIALLLFYAAKVYGVYY